MSDVFISYAREDAPRVGPLARALVAEGLTVSWDQALNAGRSWLREAEQAIREAGVVIVVWTSGSVESQWIRDEAQLAQSLGTLLPVQLDRTRSAQPIAFRNIQVFDLANWDGESADEHLQQLITLVRRRLSERGANDTVSASRSRPAALHLPPIPGPQPAPPPPSIAARSPAPAPPAGYAPSPVPPPIHSQDLEIPAFLRRLPAETSAPPVQADPFALPAPIVTPPVASAPARLPPAQMQPPDVFVAYSRKDELVCRQVVTALRSEGLNVFYDQYIEGGQEWREMIAWNIKCCSVFMVLFSGNSLKSDQVRKEVNHATDNSRSVVPVMIENVKLDGGLALELNGINFIPYYDNPPIRLSEVVEKARNLAAIAVFDQRREYIQSTEINAFLPQAGNQLVAHNLGSAPRARWGRGLVAIAGAIVLSGSTAVLLTPVTGRGGMEWTAILATGLFFIALPYVISIMMLFNRFLRGT